MPVNDGLASEQWIRFQYCRDRGHLEFINKADKCDRFFAGEQWLGSDDDPLGLQRNDLCLAWDVDAPVSRAAQMVVRRRDEIRSRRRWQFGERSEAQCRLARGSGA